MRLIAIMLMLMLPFHLFGCQQRRDPAKVRINGKEWFVDLAMTNKARYKGLSGRGTLPDDVGMLFMYPRPEVLNFCMRGCPVSLDIAFLDANLRVVRMYTMQVEEDQAGRVPYSSVVPAQYVLETAEGALGKAGVAVGAKAEFLGDIPPAIRAEDGP